jgi:ribosome-associated protein
VIRISDTLAINDRAITESFVRASGPGGQNVNKLATAVQLRLDLAASGLPDDVQARLAGLGGRRLNQSGELVITVQRHRTQERNRAAAMDQLIRLVQRAKTPPAKRIVTKPTAASRKRRLDAKARRARLKQTRGAPVAET